MDSLAGLYQEVWGSMEPEVELDFFDIDDLIKTKKIRQRNVKDLQDIEYLLKAKKMNEEVSGVCSDK